MRDGVKLQTVILPRGRPRAHLMSQMPYGATAHMPSCSAHLDALLEKVA